MKDVSYAMFKGLQRPLEFMGIRGRFLIISACAIGGSFLGFLLISFLFGKVAGFSGMFVIAGISFVTILIKQKQGLHNRRRNREIFIYHNLKDSPFN